MVFIKKLWSVPICADRRALMEAAKLPSFGKLVKLEELNINMPVNLIGTTVRITGRLQTHDFGQCHAVITDSVSTHSVLIDTRLIEPFQAKLGVMFQFIGELDQQSDSDKMLLRARVVRCVEGLDWLLYNRAMDIQRQYLEHRGRLGDFSFS